ncbi:hypothetical protein IMZ48_06270 [Candidatus Bathyarchaeota archaeon]|nr:hypothetical protein [Candidatus Bathyarchaeota archaeon]
MNSRLDDMVDAGRDDNETWQAMGDDARNYVYGNQLHRMGFRDGWERPQFNYLYPAMMQQLAMLYARKPLLLAEAQEPQDAEAAKVWQGLLRFQFENDLEMADKMFAAIMDGWVYGHYVARVLWEDKVEWLDAKKQWKGGPQVNLMAPEFFGCDPEAERATRREAGFVYGHRRVLVSYLLERYPKFKDAIEVEARSKSTDPESATGQLLRAVSGDTRTTQSDGDQAGQEIRDREARLVNAMRNRMGFDRADTDVRDKKTGLPRYVTILEAFFHEGGTKGGKIEEPVPAEELVASGEFYADETQQVYLAADGDLGMAGDLLRPEVWPIRVVQEWKDEPLWPNGRRILRVGDKCILNPREEEQRWEFKEWPFVVGVLQPLPHTWHGLNGAELCLGLQDAVNEVGSHVSTWIKQFASPVNVTEEGAIASTPGKVAQKLKARAGAIIVMAKGAIDKFRRDPPPPMGAGMTDAYGMLTRELQDQTGSQEVARGRQAKGDATATEINELQRASKVRVSMAAMFQDKWAADVMRRVAELNAAYMEPGSTVRVLGEGAARVMAQLPADSVAFDVKLGVGTALPFDQERTRQKLVELYTLLGDSGVAILPQLLAAFEIENPEKVLGQVQGYQQFLVFQQQQQALEQEAQAQAGVPA